MPIGIRPILDSFRDAIGRIVIILGAFFILIAVLYLRPAYQWVSCLSLLLGVTSIIIGIALHFEAFKWKVPSLEGLGTILMYVSPLFMAAALVTLIFALPTDKFLILPAYWGDIEDSSPFFYIPPTYTPGHYGQPRNRANPDWPVYISVITCRPYAWLAAPLVLTGLGFLAFGFLARELA